MKIVESPNTKQHIAGHIEIRAKNGSEIVRINVHIPHCPHIFPHAVSNPCGYCTSLYEDKRDLLVQTWRAAYDTYAPPEVVPLKRRLGFAITRLINWIGSWSKN